MKKLKGPLEIDSSSVPGFSFFQRLLRDEECYGILRTFLLKESHFGKDILEFWYVEYDNMNKSLQDKMQRIDIYIYIYILVSISFLVLHPCLPN